MDAMLPSRLGKLRILCSLPLFSDAIRLKSQSAAEHGFTEALLSIALAPQLGIPVEAECDLVELAIFAELPKAYLGDPSYYLRQRHPEAQTMYRQVRGRLWKETESSFGVKTSRSPQLFGVHSLVDAFAAMLFIEKECLLGNQYFAAERHRTHYATMRAAVRAGKTLKAPHPATLVESEVPLSDGLPDLDWKKAVAFLDDRFADAERARLEGGVGEYSSTFLGMMEKLKEHYRYKGWSAHYPESVGEHTYQVLFLAWQLAGHLGLSAAERVKFYRLAAFHDLAEAYASDVVYPVKVREKDLGKLHQELEARVTADISAGLGFALEKDPKLHALVDICDRFSAQLYFDRERRSGNTHFFVPNTSMEHTRRRFGEEHKEAFLFLDTLWAEYQACFTLDTSPLGVPPSTPAAGLLAFPKESM
jgi:5'-deoxynucleotidase YfbR-like HD superfamily hydrolase